jgi:hypothetical protein
VVARQTSTYAKNGREAVNKRPKAPPSTVRFKVDYARVQPLQLEDRAKINAAGSGFCADCVISFAVELMAGDVHGGGFVV